MVGRELGEFFVRTRHDAGRRAACGRGLGRAGVVQGVTFEVHPGEVLGFAGLVGAGRTDIGLALFGIAPADQGTIDVDGAPVTIRTPQDAMRLGIAYLSEDRRKLGLSMPQSVAVNISLPSCSATRTPFGLSTARPSDAGRTLPRPPADPHAVVRYAGRQPVRRQPAEGDARQVAQHRARASSILDEPTRGIDVGAKADVHQLVDDLAREGMAVILISSDLPEVLAMSDRILVMREGRAAATLDLDEVDQERVMAVVGSPLSRRRERGVDRWVGQPGRPGAAIKELTLLGLIVVTLFGFNLVIDNYSRRAGFFNRIDDSVAITAVLAAGQAVVIITRHIDLSVGSILGVSAFLTGDVLVLHHGMPAVVAVLLAVAIGACSA